MTLGNAFLMLKGPGIGIHSFPTLQSRRMRAQRKPIQIPFQGSRVPAISTTRVSLLRKPLDGMGLSRFVLNLLFVYFGLLICLLQTSYNTIYTDVVAPAIKALNALGVPTNANGVSPEANDPGNIGLTAFLVWWGD